MIVQAEFCSECLHRNKRANILLPPGYDSGARRAYPLLILLHGFGGNRDTWLNNTPLLELVAAHDLIVVLPESLRRWFINDHEGYEYENYLIKELIPYVETHFRAIAERGARGIAGFSMGGATAVMHLLQYPTLFSAAASHSGAFDAPQRAGDPYAAQRSDPNFMIPSIASHEQVWGPVGSPTRKKYDPYRLAAAWDNFLPISLYLDIGKEDYPRMLQMNRRFQQVLADKHIPYEYHEYPGGHDWRYLNHVLPYSFEFMRRKLSTRQKRRVKPT